MIPSAAERIATMVRALTDVVLPAIDPANSLAQEQARLVVGHLMVLAGHGDEALLDRLELAGECALARALVVVPAGGVASEAARKALSVALEAAAQSVDDVTAARLTLRAGIERLVRTASEDGGEDLRRATWTLVFDHCRRQAERGRAWFAAAGFDDRPMPSPRTMLADLAREIEAQKVTR